MDGWRLELQAAGGAPEEREKMCEGEKDRGKEKDGKETEEMDATVLLVLVAGGRALADLAVGERRRPHPCGGRRRRWRRRNGDILWIRVTQCVSVGICLLLFFN